MKDCEKFQEMISCLIDGELSEDERIQVENHIALCPECRAMYEDFSAVSGMAVSTLSEVPDSLHEKIMSGVKATAKKKHKPLIVRLRPYMAAAACLVVVVGAVFALDNGFGMEKSADSAAPGASAPAEAPMEMADSYYGFSTEEAENTSDKSSLFTESTNGVLDEAPADMMPEAPAAEPSDDADAGCEFGCGTVRSLYTPGMSIDSAVLRFYEEDGSLRSLDISDTGALAKALAPDGDFVGYSESSFEPFAELELVCGGESYVLELCRFENKLLLRQDTAIWIACMGADEFLEIF